MGVRHTIKMNRLPDIAKRTSELKGKSVEVGAFGENGWLAGIHEYGCDITAKRAQALTVPCSRAAYGKKASDFPDLFVLKAKSGKAFLARKKGTNDVELLFWLTKSVHIPERSFLRAGHDTHIAWVLQRADRLTGLLNDGALSAEQYMNQIGELMADKVKEYAKGLSSPAKASVTLEANGGKTNPLFDTGQMIGSITYRAV